MEILGAINTKQTRKFNMSSDEKFYGEKENEEVGEDDGKCYFREVGWITQSDRDQRKSILGRQTNSQCKGPEKERA